MGRGNGEHIALPPGLKRAGREWGRDTSDAQDVAVGDMLNDDHGAATTGVTKSVS